MGISLKELQFKTEWINEFDDEFELVAEESVIWAFFAVNLPGYENTRFECIPKEHLEDGCFDCWVESPASWRCYDELSEIPGFDFSQVTCCRWIVS